MFWKFGLTGIVNASTKEKTINGTLVKLNGIVLLTLFERMMLLENEERMLTI